MLRAALLASALLWACGESAQRRDADAGVAQGGFTAGRPAGAAAGSDAGRTVVSNDAGSLGDAGLLNDAGSQGDGGSLNDAGSQGGVHGPDVAGAFNGGGGAGGSGGGGAGSSGSYASAAGGSGGTAGTSTETASLCELVEARLEIPSKASAEIGQDFRNAVDLDCRYQGLYCNVAESAWPAFAGGVRIYGLELWHCEGSAAQKFRLVHPGQKVTEADAEALVDLYVYLTMRNLKLSANDVAGLRSELLALMPSSVAADAPAISLCDSGGVCPRSAAAGGGGIGGAGGSNGGMGGAANHAGTD